jgi:hypothetical protein
MPTLKEHLGCLRCRLNPFITHECDLCETIGFLSSQAKTEDA